MSRRHLSRASGLLGGWARALLRNARNELVGGAGLSVNREKPVEGETTTNLEAAAGFDYANFAYDFPNTDIQVAAMGYLGLNQWGRYRLESSASLRREVFSDFYFASVRLQGLRELRQRARHGGRAEERLGTDLDPGLLVLSACLSVTSWEAWARRSTAGSTPPWGRSAGRPSSRPPGRSA